ncbi:hypothetical protein GCM10028803_00450 [Larkinella knui]|uniref:Uncharacterized protein n=1 Tax=Larkinella knui TaxID=2025310 RepID=A0A3P1CJL8_9BACT|nr:hypothetical protein [Larkinella knui]RRB13449.1 hypothetical protein EHT87_14325 [Larkinella knui]
MLIGIDKGLEQLGETLIGNIQASQKRRGMYASGRSARSLRQLVQRSGSIASLQVHGSGLWRFQAKGRGPTQPGTAHGSPTLVEALRQWAKDKGISINEYALAKKIHREGIKVPNPHNDGRVLSDPLEPGKVTGLLKTTVRPILIQSIRQQLFNN